MTIYCKRRKFHVKDVKIQVCLGCSGMTSLKCFKNFHSLVVNMAKTTNSLHQSLPFRWGKAVISDGSKAEGTTNEPATTMMMVYVVWSSGYT